jgi:hypothetical protein
MAGMAAVSLIDNAEPDWRFRDASRYNAPEILHEVDEIQAFLGWSS